MKNTLPTFDKTAVAVLDYSFDWSAWLAGDQIEDFDVTVPDGLVRDSQSIGSNVVTVWLSGGTVGQSYRVRCQVTTTAGRTDERSILVNVVQAR